MSETNAILLSHLIPVPEFTSGFTTCKYIQHSNLEQAALNDSDLGVHRVSPQTSHKVVELPSSSVPDSGDTKDRIPPPASAWEALYPERSINPTADLPGGFGFYLSGPKSFADDLAGASEAVFSYRMMLEEGWEWVKGGKLPGVFGGVGTLSYGCTGGRQEQRCQCFNIRPMWRSQGQGELYTYLPMTPENDDRLASVPPLSKKNNDYGFSVGRGAFNFNCAVNKWVSLAFRIRLNEVGVNDGEFQLWVDGESVINVDGLSFRNTSEGKIKGVHFQTFFGGHTKEWASPKDQRAWFSDVTGVILR